MNDVLNREAINVREYRATIIKNDNPEKLATYGIQDEEKQKHNTIYMCFVIFLHAHKSTKCSSLVTTRP